MTSTYACGECGSPLVHQHAGNCALGKELAARLHADDHGRCIVNGDDLCALCRRRVAAALRKLGDGRHAKAPMDRDLNAARELLEAVEDYANGAQQAGRDETERVVLRIPWALLTAIRRECGRAPNVEPMEVDPDSWTAYDEAARWCAERGLSGAPGTKLPETFSAVVLAEIAEHPDEFEERVRGFAYARAMEPIAAALAERERMPYDAMGDHPPVTPREEGHAVAPPRCGKYGCTRREGHGEDCCAPELLCGSCKAEEARKARP
jgi:hypothetical protein